MSEASQSTSGAPTTRGAGPTPGEVAPASRRRDRFAALARSVVNLSAVVYLLALLAMVAALRLIGERWWVTTIALYLPRIGFALPLPLLIVALLIARSYRLLVTQVIAAFVLLFPLMGLHLGGARAATPGAQRFRLFTLNTGSGEERHRRDPRSHPWRQPRRDRARGGGRRRRGGAPPRPARLCLPAPRPVRDRQPISHRGRGGASADLERWQRQSAQYAHCRLLTPAGPIRLFAVHPISPHDAFNQLRGRGLSYELLSGRILRSVSARTMEANTRQRLEQVRALAADAAKSSEPVIIAGDTNLPGLSWAFSHWLGGLQRRLRRGGPRIRLQLSGAKNGLDAHRPHPRRTALPFPRRHHDLTPHLRPPRRRRRPRAPPRPIADPAKSS